jgi:hypothetical protein
VPPQPPSPKSRSQGLCVDDQSVSERYDIISRVFRLKLKAMMADFKKGLLGRCAADIMCVEWQKRGLPHAHILLFFAPEDKLTTTEEYDRVVCAEIPDPLAEPVLHERVLRFMIHGPCHQATLQVSQCFGIPPLQSLPSERNVCCATTYLRLPYRMCSCLA